MAKKKNSTKSTEPVVPPEVVSENVESGETQPPVEEIKAEDLLSLEGGAPDPEFVPPAEEPKAEDFSISFESTGTLDETLEPETNTVTNLPLQEGEEPYTVTREDLERNPQLIEEGVQEGEQIILGPVVSPEEIVLDALSESDDFVEINEVLEQFVKNPEDQQENRFLKKLLSDMVASGEIEVQNQVHLLLGSAYYKAGDPVTRYQTLRTVPVYAKKRS